jgi:hypothetical protein
MLDSSQAQEAVEFFQMQLAKGPQVNPAPPAPPQAQNGGSPNNQPTRAQTLTER